MSQFIQGPVDTNQITSNATNISKLSAGETLGTAASLSDLQTLLSNKAALMTADEVKPIRVYMSPAFETFKQALYLGHLFCNYNNGTRIDFTVTFHSGFADSITIARINGSWRYTDTDSNLTNEITNVKTGTELAQNTDLNNVITLGHYYHTTNSSAATITNRPITDARGFGLDVTRVGGSARICQIYDDNQNNARYIRHLNGNSVQTDWQKIGVVDLGTNALKVAAPGDLAAQGSKDYYISNASRLVIFAIGNSSVRCACYIVYSNNSGDITYVPILTGGQISIASTTTNKLSLSNSGSVIVRIHALVFDGNITLYPTT